MAEVVQSLFGVTPQSYQRAQQQNIDAQALRYAQLDPFERATYGITRGANMLGGAVAGAFGVQDPELQRITMRQQIAGQLDPNDLSTFQRGIEVLRQAGDGQGALMLAAEAEKVRPRIQLAQEAALKQKAQQVAQGAYQPGGEAALYGQPTEMPLRDDEGNLMPGAGVTAPSYDIGRVAPQLMAMGPAGQSILLGAAKVNEEMARAEKLAAEALTAQQEAAFAGPAKKAEAEKKIADASKAAVEAQFAERLQQAGLNKTNWDVANLRSQINDRSAKLALDQQVTAANVAEKMATISKNLNEMPSDTRKLVNESATLAASSKQSADQFNNLASRIEAQGGNYGVASSASDFMKKIGGFQGGMTQLKQEYARLRNNAAIKSLPPGPATDKDIQLALSGFPTDTARAGDLAAFLRGMAKLQDIDASIANAKTDWLAQNNGALTRTNRTLMVGDFSARPGESFNDLTSRIVKDVNARYAGTGQDARRQALVNQIPTNQPAPAARPSVIDQADAIINRTR